MANDSIDIDDTKGDVSGVIKDSIGSIAGKVVKIGVNLVINNYTNQEVAALKKLKAPSEISSTEQERVIQSLLQGIKEIKNLLETNQAQTIKAGNVQISHNELLSNELILKGDEDFFNGNHDEALSLYNRAKDINPKMDSTLRTERITVYKDLWKYLKPLARYPQFKQVTYRELAQVAECLSAWYHDEAAGLLVSGNSRYCYDALQKKITEVIRNKDIDEFVPVETLDNIASVEARELRAALARDVGTRR